MRFADDFLPQTDLRAQNLIVYRSSACENGASALKLYEIVVSQTEI